MYLAYLPNCHYSRHLRNEMSQAALERIQNLSDDDIFLSFDADELPKKEVRLNLEQWFSTFGKFCEPLFIANCNLTTHVQSYKITFCDPLEYSETPQWIAIHLL